MPRADQVLYSALLHAGKLFQDARLPLLGVVGTDLVAYGLAWRPTARAALQAPPPGAGLTEGVALLAQLQLQLEALQQAEDHTREALEEWTALSDRHSKQLERHGWGSGGGSAAAPLPFAAAAAAASAAAEEGLQLLTRQSQQLADPLMFSEMDEAEEEAESSAAAGEAAAAGEESLGGGELKLQPSAVLTLDGLAAAVRQQHPLLFGNGSSGARQQDQQQQQAQQAQALCEVLYRQLRFKHEPFEWVYEGLLPLFLPPLLRRRKLTPLTLAVVAAALARRLGLPLLPLPAHSAEAVAAAHMAGAAAAAAAAGSSSPEASADASAHHHLRSDLAQRYAAKAQIAAPTAEPWVLMLPTAAAEEHGSSSSPQQQGSSGARGGRPPHLLIDAGTGKPLDAAAAQLHHPALSQADAAVANELVRRAPLLAWQHSVRSVVQAHQRRGESDLVAHWVYVALALDPQAPEWQHVLRGSEL